MNAINFFKRTATAVATLAGLASGSTLAGTYDLTWNTVDGGGLMGSTGGTFAVSGTIGQPDAGAMTGGNYSVVGGFWAVTTDSGPCFGDLNGDRKVDLGDLSQLLAHYGQTGAQPNDGDLNGDSIVDLSDLSALLSVYGNVCP